MTTIPVPTALLGDVLDVLYHDAGDLIENCSLLDRVGEDTVPREGTMDPDIAGEAEELLALIRRLEAAGARPIEEQPAWLIDVVQGRRAL